MTFLNPFLAGLGLACVAIPIVIHFLMRRRRKPVMWGAMRFLLEAYRQHRRRLKLEQFLLLAARCLLLALLALGLGRPLVGAAMGLAGRGAVSVYLLVDNGIASSALTGGGGADRPALERHKAAAAGLLKQVDAASGDRVGLITLGGPARAAVMPPSSDAAAVGDLVKNLAPTDSATDLAGALAMVRDDLDSAGKGRARAVVVILSDFLAGSAGTQHTLVELGRREGLTVLASRPLEGGAANVSVVGLEPLSPVVLARQGEPSRPMQVRVSLARSGPGVAQAGVSTVSLGVQTESTPKPAPAGQVVVRWSPGQSEAAVSGIAELSALGAAGGGSGVLLGSADADAIGADNVFRRPIEVRRSLRVGIVAPRSLGSRSGLQQFEPEDWFRLALQPTESGRDPEIEVSEVEPATVDGARLSGLDAVIITRPDLVAEGAWKRLRAFADGGGLVVVSPPAKATVHLWADAMVRELGLPWDLSREARAFEQGAGLSGDRGADAGALLSQIGPELAELVKPVRVFRALAVDPSPGAAERGATPLRLENGAALLAASRPGVREAAARAEAPEPAASHGLVVLFAAAPSFDWTDLQAKPLMVPLVQEIVRQGVGRAHGSWAGTAGQALQVPAQTAELRPVGEVAPIRIAAARATEPVRRAGLWRAIDDRGLGHAMVAVNADAAGARADAQPSAAVGAWLGAAFGGEQVQWLEPAGALASGAERTLHATGAHADSTRYVLPLLLGALAVGIVELLMARFFSHATIGAGRAAGAAGGAARTGSWTSSSGSRAWASGPRAWSSAGPARSRAGPGSWRSSAPRRWRGGATGGWRGGGARAWCSRRRGRWCCWSSSRSSAPRSWSSPTTAWRRTGCSCSPTAPPRWRSRMPPAPGARASRATRSCGPRWAPPGRRSRRWPRTARCSGWASIPASSTWGSPRTRRRTASAWTRAPPRGVAPASARRSIRRWPARRHARSRAW
jgi:hypothetical protein